MSMPETGSEGHVAVQDTHSILPPAALAIRTTSLAKMAIPADAVRTLPGEFVKRHLVLPLQLYNGTLEVATAQLGNQRVIDDIRLLSGLEVKEVLMPASEILERIAECYQGRLRG